MVSVSIILQGLTAVAWPFLFCSIYRTILKQDELTHRVSLLIINEKSAQSYELS